MAPSHLAELRGRVLSGRYRLVRPLGSGASAAVYLADDITLGRRVAVKVLHPALADDQGFLRRFRAEAQLVAGLRHPNILRVYDWGEDNATPYLVTELLVGGSLRSVLDQGLLLTPEQAARVAIEAASALDYAHSRGLVHRDIKPANLLLDEDGHVSVADFGLARALAEATWTEPAGAMLGTARYAAPEQASSAAIDGRADVYALALVVVEAVTGHVPFSADTTLGTMMARIGRPLPIPEELAALRIPLEEAGRPDPEQRAGAARFAILMTEAAAQLPPPRPLVLAGPLVTGFPDLDTVPTELPGGRPRLFDGEAADDAGAAIADPVLSRPSAVPSPEPLWSPGPPVGSDLGRAGADDPDHAVSAQPSRRRRRWPWLVVLLAVVLAAGVVTAIVVVDRPLPRRPVPALVGHTVAQARQAVIRPHFVLVVGPAQYSQTIDKGIIISQQPSGGLLREHKTITVVPSLGLPPVTVPGLSGLTPAQAQLVLAGARFKLGSQTLAFSPTVPRGELISWTGKGGQLPQGSTVNLVVSNGPATVPVPNVVSMTFAQAQAALANVNLSATESDQYSDTVPKGTAIATAPAVGTTVPSGSGVTVVISLGPHLVAIPSTVKGQSIDQAVATLQAAGLSVSGVDGSPTAPVTGTIPATGGLVHIGSSVTLVT